jgi:hypothetical protein
MNRYRATTDTADKHAARDIEARERSRILEGRHGIRRQPDITFKTFAEVYLRDHAELHKRSVSRDREILKVLNRSFGSLILHEITTHRIEQFKRAAGGEVARAQHVWAPEADQTSNREPRAGHAEIAPIEGGGVGQAARLSGPSREAAEGGTARPKTCATPSHQSGD